MSFSKPSDVEDSWQFISEGVDVLMKRDLRSLGLTTKVYMNMYTAIHNFCVSTHPVSTKSQGPRGGRGHHTKLLGGELYSRLCEYLREHLQNLYTLAPVPTQDQPTEVWHDQLLRYYNSCWSRYLIGAKYLDHIFSYLNRHWVKQERDEGGRKRGVYEVNTLCLVLWRDCMFLPLEPKILEVLLSSIRRDRDGKLVDYASLQCCIHSMVQVGFDDQNSKRTNLLFYSDHFEKAFLTSTANYYSTESQRLLSEEGVVKYMRRVGHRLGEERSRVSRYLHQSTEELLMSECEHLLIQNHAAVIQTEFLGLLDADSREDLHTMFILLRKIPFGLDPIRLKLENFVEQSGMSRIEALLNENNTQQQQSEHQQSSAPQYRQVDPRNYVLALLDVFKHFESLLRDSFENWPAMKEAIDHGCVKFINYNSIAKPSPAAESQTPELLSRCADSLLKKSSRHGDVTQVEAGVEGVLGLLQYTEEKDVFEKHYSRMLSRRLVHQTSSSHDLELKMVSRLGEICGFEYTNKLQRMFQDVATSEKLQNQFKETENSKEANAFAPFILAKGFWPLPHRDVPEFELPKTLKDTFDHFVEFYDKVHNGRKLKWLWNFGKGEMKLNMPNGKILLLQVSIYQMMILLAFNDADTLTLDQIKEDVQLPDELLDGSLGYIVKSGILVESPARVYSFNENFKSKRMRVNLNLPLKIDTKQEANESEQQLEEQRQGFLQAVIVRVMKARKIINHAQLIEDVMQQALSRFKPTVKDVKKALTTLLEREFLRRVGDSGDEYEYTA